MKIITLILLMFTVSIQAQESCIVTFPLPAPDEIYSIWVRSEHLYDLNNYHYFRVLYLPHGDTFLSCVEMGMQESISYKVMKVIDTVDIDGFKINRAWGQWEDISIDYITRPMPPTNLDT